jgi:CRISPR system Cascade subunit CasE
MKGFPSQGKGGPGQVLFRLDIDAETGNVTVLVQSEKEPQWNVVTGRGGYLTAVKCKQFQPILAAGQRLRFRLRANPTKRLGKSAGAYQGKRVGIYDENEQVQWLKEKLEGVDSRPQVSGGFKLVSCQISREEKIENSKAINRNDRSYDLKLFSVQFDGVLDVVEPDKAIETISTGIGSAKGFGFGLLSVAPYRGD